MRTNIGCENFRGVAIAENAEKHKIAQLRCKQWDCLYCAHQNALQWRAAIIDYINKSDHEWSFWTLTMPAWIHRQEECKRYEKSCQQIQRSWDKFAKRAKRQFGKFQYLRVLETHKSGVIHIHLLASVFLPDCRRVVRDDNSIYYTQSDLKQHATDCGFGYIHDFRNLLTSDDKETGKYGAGSVANYVTKYITKDLAEHDQTRKDLRVRKIQTSRGIKRVNIETDEDWQLKSGIYYHEFIKRDKPTHDVTTGSLVTLEHFRGGVVYPPIFHPDLTRV